MRAEKLSFFVFGAVFCIALVFLSCLEGDGQGLDENGFCQPTDLLSFQACPELCDTLNKKHLCYDSCKVQALDSASGKFVLNDTCSR